MLEASVIFAVAVIGGLAPLLVSWTEERLHAALALSTGVFLGAVFLHLLPSLSELAPATEQVSWLTSLGHSASDVAHSHDDPGHLLIWIFVLVGVLGLYLVEALFLRAHDADDLHRHRSVGYAALLGLSLHGLTTGIGYALADSREGVADAVFVAIVGHKGFEAFSVTSVFRLAEFSRRRVTGLVLLFALVTPLGILLGEAMTASMGTLGVAVVTALAAGTFLYICLGELLPEVFHMREQGPKNVAWLVAGIVVMAAFDLGVS